MATDSRHIEDIVRGIRESTYEIQTESRLAYSGLKREQDTAGVLERYAWLYSVENVRRAEEAYRAEVGPAKQERLRRVFHYLLGGYVERRTARSKTASSPSRRALPSRSTARRSSTTTCPC